MATYTTSLNIQADGVVVVVTASHVITVIVCEAEATVSMKKAETSIVASAGAVATITTEHIRPAIAEAVCIVTTAKHSVTTIEAVADAVAVVESFYGVPSQARFELFVATDGAAFDFSTPDETFTSLPHETSLILATGTHELVLRKRNKWGFTSLNIEVVTIVVDAGGSGQPPVPSAPEQVATVQDAF